MNNNLELLSPAGSWEALVAAIQNGADAIYMGGTKFNARRLTDNFDDENLKKAVDYAHLYGVKIYITVNILIKEKELDELQDFLYFLEELKVDGVLVQDLGVAAIIIRDHPRLALHASTQMTIHQLEGTKVLEKLGFSRVVPARELTLKELQYIHKNSDLEIESFIHGAMCVSYSGQCLMSSMLGGRSGNRGMCAQPCRLPYSLKSGNILNPTDYQISLKDLSTIEDLTEIIRSGVTSFKIEGRMKRPEYVAIVTKEYRMALDAIIGTGYYEPDDGTKKELLQIFNRGGFSSGYYYGTEQTELFSREKPNHWGVYLGKVKKCAKNTIFIELEEEVKKGDSIEFWIEGELGKGQNVTNISYQNTEVEHGIKGQTIGVKSSITVKPGTIVYRTSQIDQLKRAQETYSNKYGRKIPISAKAVFKIGEKPTLTLKDLDGNESYVIGDFVIEKAIKKAITVEEITDRLGKLGDTPFNIDHLEIEIDEDMFMPVSVLNQLRRDASSDLMDKRISYYGGKINPRCVKSNMIEDYKTVYKETNHPLLCGYVEKLDLDTSFLEGLNMLSYSPITFPFDLDGAKENIERLHKRNIKVRLTLPRLTRKDDMDLLRSLPDDTWIIFDSYQVGNLGQIKLLEDKGVKNIHSDYSLNITNSVGATVLKHLGIEGFSLSPELTIGEIHDIIKNSPIPSEIFVYGRIPLMNLEYCPHSVGSKNCENCKYVGDDYSLIDRKNYEFPLIKHRIARCYTELLNSQPIFLADNMSAFKDLHVSIWGLHLEGLSQLDICSIISLYRYQIDHPSKYLPDNLSDKAEEFKSTGFTRGHFFHGVK